MGLPAKKRDQPSPGLPIRAAEELARLEKELGGRQALVEALTFAPLGKDARYVLGLLGDPDHQAHSLAEICRVGKILPGQLVEMLAKGTEIRSRLLATQLIARRAPAVVREVMERAATYEDLCPQCNGTGSATPDPTEQVPNPEPVKCQPCLGGGKLRYDADPVCREQALEMAGLLGKGGGISIVNQNTVVNQQQGSVLGFERMQEAMDEILFGRGAAVDAEAVDGAVAPPQDAGHADPEEAPEDDPGA